MSSQTLNARMAQKNDTSTNWTTKNPVLLKGEIGIETDTKKIKIGDGTTAWTSLTYANITSLSDLGLTATSTELNYVDGVTSAIQTQLNAKAPTASPTFTGTVTLPSTTSIGTVTNTEIGYLDGVTSAIQTQLDNKVTKNTNITAGTSTKITYDAKGLVTAGTSLSATDIPVLDASKITTGVFDSARLPSYVDDVLEYANQAGFPATGETGKIYVALDTNKTYRWSGSAYVHITSGAVDSVNGQTGVITLTTTNINEGTNLYYTDARVATKISATASTALSDGASICKTTNTFIIDCGNATL